MLDIRLIREHPDVVEGNLKKRRDPEKLEMLDELIQHDKKWREQLTGLNELRHKMNLANAKIAELKKAGKDTAQKIEEAREIERQIEKAEKSVKEDKEKIDYILMRLPNLLHESVPLGESEEDNVPIREWGEMPRFDFPVKDHIDLAVGLDIMDVERASKVSGARFYYLKNEGVSLDLALIEFSLNELVRKGYIPIEPPFMMRRRPYEGVTALSDFEEMLYKVQDEDLYLIATSEHPIAAMFMDEVLNAQDLPLKYVGISANFRKEAGAHGKDTRGIFRTHQFNKVEQFILCTPEDSWTMHEELIGNAEELVQKLGLPHQVVNVCTGDIGTVAAKKYDIETWMPAQSKYREIISCSNCTDYQARRLNIKYREKEGAPTKGFVHTLNSTALATGRTMVAILGNYQQKDGSVVIPEVLRTYMKGTERIRPR
ncbi:MAG: serine--tRNA ligase [Candidatus Bathyarchaeota archaeon]|jgi:seryl-tRNA synthetase|nr:serine--tRNA ligase [Candidatus Bathyarchaeota archaeon]